MNTLTREQVRRVDQLAIEQLGIPGIVLMENACRNAADAIDDWLEHDAPDTARNPIDAPVAILCGGGNNGGDGFGLARHLHNRGHNVTLYAAKDPAKLEGDAAIMASITQTMKLPLHTVTTAEEVAACKADLANARLIIDALLGTGFHGDVREPMATLIDQANKAGPPIVALDVPSGLDCQTGKPANVSIKAALTITFAANKAGFENESAKPYLGRLVVKDIGAPPSLIEQARQTDASPD